MKTLISIIMISLGASFACAFAGHTKAVEKNESSNIVFITQLYKDFFQKKNFDQMDKYLSKDIVFYKDFDRPVNYNALQEHLIAQGKQCVKLSMLPFNDILVSGNKVVVLYTQDCTDKFGKINQKRIMAIMEMNTLRKVSRIWVVTHEKKESV
ncbi:MAG: hypothetical protein ABI597_08840 [Gammaproteobacteria bacterium]